MALPTDLVAKGDRIFYSASTNTWWFRCQRAGHSPHRESRDSKRAIEDYRYDHDGELHLNKGTRAGSESTITLGMACADTISTFEALVSAGQKDPETLKYYRLRRDRVIASFGASRLLASIDKQAAKRHVAWCAVEHRVGEQTFKPSGGASAVKDLKFITMLAGDRRVELGWAVDDRFVQEISPRKNPKRKLPIEALRAFIEALKSGSVAHAFTLLKAATLLRDVELHHVTVEDLNLTTKVAARSNGHIPPLAVRYYKRAKRTRATEYTYQPIPAELVPILEPFTKDKHPAAWLLPGKGGRRMTHSTLRKARLKAWAVVKENLGVEPANSGLSQFRHQIGTLLRKEKGSDTASKLAGHSLATFEKFYDLDFEDFEKKKEGSDAVAEIIQLRKPTEKKEKKGRR